MKFADRLDGVTESATLRLNAMATQLKSQGIDVVNLTAGEPDANVLDPIKAAVEKALRENRSKYTPVPGIPDLRAAIAQKTNLQQPKIASPWTGKNVVVTNGGKQAIYNVIQAMVNPGDSVQFITPYWLSYPEMVKLAGGKPEALEPTDRKTFKLSPKELEEALHAKVKLFILNSPSNPAGVTYSLEEYQKLGEIFQKALDNGHDFYILSDEIYDRIVFTEAPFVSWLRACPGLQSRTITVNGLSKSSAMTGWRVGWSVASEEMIQVLSTLQGQQTSGISSLTQYAAVEALRLPDTDYQPMVQKFKDRQKLTLSILNKFKKMKWVSPEGAFYFFLDMSSYLKRGETAAPLAERLLSEAHVAVVPGEPFGAPNWIRISFALDERELVKGLEKMHQFLEGA